MTDKFVLQDVLLYSISVHRPKEGWRMLRWKGKSLDHVSTKTIKKNWGAYGLLTVALFAMAFFGVCDPSSSRLGPGNTNFSGDAAKIGNEAVTESEFRRTYSELYSQYARQFQDGFNPAMFELAKMTINQLIDQRIYVLSAQEAGVVVGSGEVDKILTDAEAFKDENGKFSGERFDEYLRANRYTEKSFEDDMKRRLSVDKYRRFVNETFVVSDAAIDWAYKLSETKLDIEYAKFAPGMIKVDVTQQDIDQYVADPKNQDAMKAYFDKNQNEFNRPKKVQARHILTAFQGARNAAGDAAKRSKDDAMKLAMQVLEEVKKPGSDFVALANKNTDDSSGNKNGGDLGLFTKEMMVKEFSDKAFAMNVGEVSELVESPFGFHIIKVEKIEEAKTTSLEEGKRFIAEKILMKEKAPSLLKEKAQALIAASKAGQDQDMAKQLGVTWAATGSFSLDSKFVPGLGSDAKLRDAALLLTDANRVHPEVLDVNGTLYVIKLKSRVNADMSKLDTQKRKQLADYQKMQEAFSFISSVKNAKKDSLEKADRIKRNESYLALDKETATPANQGS